MILKVGKKYMTRCGFIAGEMVGLDGEGRYVVRYTNMEGAAFQEIVYETGFVLPPGMGRHPLDLVSEIPKESTESPVTPAPALEPDLEPATFDWNKPFQARDGRKARRVSDKGSGRYSNIIIYDTNDGCEGAGFVTNEGRVRGDGTASSYDLVNIDPEPAQAPTPVAAEGFDPSKPYTARTGKKAEILGTLEKGQFGDTFVVRYTGDDGIQYASYVKTNGRAFDLEESAADLVNVKTKHVGYIGVYTPLKALSPVENHLRNKTVGYLYASEDMVPLTYCGDPLHHIVRTEWEE